MSSVSPAVRLGLIARILQRLNLRFPGLFLLLVGLTVVDYFVPDPIPFIDEVLLTVLTLIFGLWKERRRPVSVSTTSPPPPPNGQARLPGPPPRK